MKRFRSNHNGTNEDKRETIQLEGMVFASFVAFVVTIPRRSKQAHNSTSHAYISVGDGSSYCEHMHERTTGSGLGVELIRTPPGVARELRNQYTWTPRPIIPLLADDMRAIRALMDMEDLNNLTYWALWTSQWQGLMQNSNVLQQSDDKARCWKPAKDTNVLKNTWKDIALAHNSGCKTKLRWVLKPIKTYPGGRKRFEKPFLVDQNRSVI